MRESEMVENIMVDQRIAFVHTQIADGHGEVVFKPVSLALFFPLYPRFWWHGLLTINGLPMPVSKDFRIFSNAKIYKEVSPGITG